MIGVWVCLSLPLSVTLQSVSMDHESGLTAPFSPGSQTTATKVVYFTPRSVTPFMSTIPKPVGKIFLRDFKTLFDRPGFYIYHFKTVDKEFGMVKEEVRDNMHYALFESKLHPLLITTHVRVTDI